jgi:hypothetical protein
MRTCRKCDKEKDEGDFPLTYPVYKGKSYRRYVCKTCFAKDWNESPRSKIAKKKWRQANRPWWREYKSSRYRNDLNYRIQCHLERRMHKALRGLIKVGRTKELLGCEIDSFKLYICTKFEEGMTWHNYGLWHIDHVVPCALFDLTKPDHQRACFHFSNLQPLWAIDNIRKGKSIASDCLGCYIAIRGGITAVAKIS